VATQTAVGLLDTPPFSSLHSPSPGGGRVSPDAYARLPLAGALLVREYKGRTIQVRVLPRGFDYEGQVYKSLSAVARAVTGTHWNGYHFFGLGKKGKGHAKKKG